MKIRYFPHIHYLHTCISSVQFSCSFISDSLWPHGLQHSRLPGLTANSRSLFKLMPIEVVMPSNHHILCHHFLLLPSIFPSITVFPNESVLHIRWPKGWSLSFSISFPVNIKGWFPLALTGLISLQSKGISNLQHHNLKAPILGKSALFMDEVSNSYMTTAKKAKLWLYGCLSTKWQSDASAF